ncbi:MAG: Dabb family protein [Balneolaceae bacterium]
MNILRHILTISLFTIVLSACQPAGGQHETNSTSETSVGMLQHTVYFYLKDDVTPEEREQFETGLKKLLEIPEIHRSELGIPAKTAEREVTDHSFAYSIYTWFESMDDYEGYDKHPDHTMFIETYNHLWADVKVYDADIIDGR